MLKKKYLYQEKIRSSNTVELFGVTLVKNINFRSHIENICCKANNKRRFVFLARNFLRLKQETLLADVYILSNFRYYLVIWMFCGKCSNSLRVKPYYRYLRAIYSNHTEIYRDLLLTNGKTDIHMQNILLLIIENYKCPNTLSPTFTWDY